MKNVILYIVIFGFLAIVCEAQNLNPSTLATEQQTSYLNFDNSVYRVALANELNPAEALLTAKNREMLTRADGKIFVEIKHGWDRKDWGDLDISTIPFFEVSNEYNSLKGGWIATKNLAQLSNILPDGYRVSAANNFANDHEGITVTNSLDYQNNGAQGQGIKIGIIDSQWLSWAAAQAAGTVPANPTAQVNHINPGGAWSTGTTPHGTGVTEVIYEFAPSAEFYLHKASSSSQVGDAITQLIASGVDMVVRSATNFNSGWEDDSGDACQWVTDLTNAGILFFHGSGNFNLRHWQGQFLSNDGDLLHEWTPNVIDETNDVMVRNGQNINVFLSWPGTPSSTNDYDLFMYDENLVLLDSDTGNDFKFTSWTNNTGDSMEVKISVRRTNSNNDNFELFVPRGGTGIEYTSGSGSTGSPANCSNELSITLGVVDQLVYNNSNPPLEIFCSRGPTNGGAIKPDITAPDNVTLVSYPGGFSGASAGGPNAVGLAAVLWSEHPYLSAEGLMDVIYGLAELYNDWGDPGMDNSYGRGGIQLPNYTSNSRFIIKDNDNSGVNDRPYKSAEQADALAPEDLNLFFLGKTFDAPSTPDSDVLNKEMIYRSLKEDAIIKAN